MAVSVVVCEIFSVKEWCDLKNKVRVRSRSLEMAPFDRSHMSSNSPSIVPTWRYLVLVKNRKIFIPSEFREDLLYQYLRLTRDKSRVRVCSRSLGIAPFDRSHTSLRSSNYGTILYRLRDIASYWSNIAKFLYSTCI